MKKFIFFLLLLIPLNVYATTGIEDYKMEITVLENGDLLINEAFNMNGVYNGIDRVINYKNNYDDYYGDTISSTGDYSIYDGSGVKLNEVRGINFDKNEPLDTYKITGDLFKNVEEAVKGDYGTFVIKPTDDGYSYVIYNHSMMDKDFYLSYVLENMVVVHEDIDELDLNLFTKMDETIGNLDLIIHIPNNTELLRAWAHGANNEVEIIDNETVKINFNNLETNPNIDFRIVFDKIISSTKETRVEALDNIYEIESRLFSEETSSQDKLYEELKSEAYKMVELAENTKTRSDLIKANDIVSGLDDGDLKYDLNNRLDSVLEKIETREMNTKIICSILVLIWFVGLFIIIINIYLKRNKKTNLKEKLDYEPALVGYVMNKSINQVDFSTAIIYMIKTKLINYNYINKDFELQKTRKKLSVSNQKLVDLIFGDKNKITLNDLRRKAIKNYEEFLTGYSNWVNRVVDEGEKLNLYCDNLSIKLLIIIYSIAGILFYFAINDIPNYLNPYIMLIFSLMFLAFGLFYNKRTSLGYMEKIRWNNFRKKMFKIKKDELVRNIDEYIIYAYTLEYNYQIYYLIKKYKIDTNYNDINLINLKLKKIINTSFRTRDISK